MFSVGDWLLHWRRWRIIHKCMEYLKMWRHFHAHRDPMHSVEFTCYIKSHLCIVYWLSHTRQEEGILVHEPLVTKLMENTHFLWKFYLSIFSNGYEIHTRHGWTATGRCWKTIVIKGRFEAWRTSWTSLCYFHKQVQDTHRPLKVCT